MNKQTTPKTTASESTLASGHECSRWLVACSCDHKYPSSPGKISATITNVSIQLSPRQSLSSSACSMICHNVSHQLHSLYFLLLVIVIYHTSLSVLWRCWLGGRKGIRPVKNWVVRCWLGYLSGSRCRFAYGPADATATHYLLLQ